ncbi:hypothetical protein N7495_009249 [Penicillium taxi]|uniref:uncharacterized protein n=1 Tax=Penicillium taxi TaxID=168475 RepID=UPI002545505D|nr:uncharacterized protein N7495_009249 [Penicillium taxi]KAJ5884739.1 hypothetical protein N7495_009249 [Penicillium taxi]
MDQLSGLAAKFGGGSSSSGDKNTNTNTNTNQSGQEDYLDKALDFAEKKTGHSFGRDTNEKITDGAREQFEKFSGKKVPEKFSN